MIDIHDQNLKGGGGGSGGEFYLSQWRKQDHLLSQNRAS